MIINDLVNFRADKSEIRRRLMRHTTKKRDHLIWASAHKNDGQFYLKRNEVRPKPLQVHPKGKNVSARRLIYLLAYGEIPEGVHIKTTCCVPGCVKPEHLSIDGQPREQIPTEDESAEMLDILNAKPNV